MKDLLPKIVMTGLGTGYLRPAPGTWGSLGPCAIFLLVGYGTGHWLAAQAVMVAIALLASVGCVAYGRWAEGHFGRKDPSYCTIDEWAGQALALIALPAANPCWSALLAFFSFRILDIVKFPPARQAEKLPAGWGILTDDLVSGIYANVLCQVVLRWIVR